MPPYSDYPLQSVTTEEAVGTDRPEIAQTGDRRRLGVDGRDLVGGVGHVTLRGVTDQEIDLGGLEADHLEVEIEIQLREALELEREEVFVPACELGELVVRDDEGPDLLLGEMVEADRRNRAMPSCLAARRRPWPAMTVPVASMRSGFVKPNVRIESAIWRICFAEWVRGFPRRGARESIGRCSTWRSWSSESREGDS